MKRLLHIGCGTQPLPDWLSPFEEVRVDVDPDCNPDFVRNMLDLHDIGTFDCIYSSHCLEHLYPHEVPLALAEFRRVLNENGIVVIVVPDLEDVVPNTKPIMKAGLGLLCGLDLFYGSHYEIPHKPYMAHHCGFVQGVMQDALETSGFHDVTVQRLDNFNLCGSGRKAA